MDFSFPREFAKDPFGWIGQFAIDFKDEFVSQREAKKVGNAVLSAPGFVLDKSVGAVESLPFDSGLILTQSLSNPAEFTRQAVGAFPSEQRKVLKNVGSAVNAAPGSGLIKFAVVGLVVLALFPTIRAVSGRVGKVIA